MSVNPGELPPYLVKRLGIMRNSKLSANDSAEFVGTFQYVLTTVISMVKFYQKSNKDNNDPHYKEVGRMKNEIFDRFEAEKYNPSFLLDCPVFNAACDFLVIGYIWDALELLKRSIVKK